MEKSTQDSIKLVHSILHISAHSCVCIMLVHACLHIVDTYNNNNLLCTYVCIHTYIFTYVCSYYVIMCIMCVCVDFEYMYLHTVFTYIRTCVMYIRMCMYVIVKLQCEIIHHTLN